MRGDGSAGARAMRPFIRARTSPERVLGTEEALARLRAATELRDPLAAERVLGQYSESDDGEWLLRICVAVALQRLGQVVAGDPGDR
jgi:hypothetical protein